MAAPPFSWHRCYLGAHVGYGWGRNRNSFGNAIETGNSEGEGLPGEAGPFHHNTSGGVFGGQLGCNYQFANNWLVGIEGEVWWSGIKGSFTAPEDEPGGPGNFSRFESRNRWDGDVALRFGYTWNRHLLYGKAGVAFGNFNYIETHDDFPTTHALSCGGGLTPCSRELQQNAARSAVGCRLGICVLEQLVRQGRVQLHQLRVPQSRLSLKSHRVPALPDFPGA